MSKAGGLFLILGGLALAAYGMASDNDATEAAADSRSEVAKSPSADEHPNQEVAATAKSLAFRTVASTTTRAAKPVPTSATPVVVTIMQRPSEPAAQSPRAAPVPKDRHSLARELQNELKRVGCYEGELNGVWTPETRRAMKAFTARVNATLPVEEPDAILFAMVQGHQDKACGKPCPSGQGPSDEGRCLPNAILAKAVRKGSQQGAVRQPTSAPPITTWSTVTTASAPAPVSAFAPTGGPPPTDGRMALAGPTEPTLPSARARSPRRAPAARRASPPPLRAAMQQGSHGSWARSWLARRYDGLN